jgi:hypothetical protein
MGTGCRKSSLTKMACEGVYSSDSACYVLRAMGPDGASKVVDISSRAREDQPSSYSRNLEYSSAE